MSARIQGTGAVMLPGGRSLLLSIPSILRPPREVHRERFADAWLWCGYLALITLAELLVAVWSPQLGMVLHLALLLFLPVHATFAPSRQQPLLIALMFAPLVRVVSLALPLAGLPPVA